MEQQEQEIMKKKAAKREFWTKLSLYALFGGIIPFMFLIWRFELFGKTSKVQVGGWGLFAILFIGVFFVKTIKAVSKGIPYSIISQILDGVVRVIIPLLIAAFACWYLKDTMKQLFQFLWLTIFCESIAIVINPIPKWLHEQGIEEKEATLTRILKSLDILKDKKE